MLVGHINVLFIWLGIYGSLGCGQHTNCLLGGEGGAKFLCINVANIVCLALTIYVFGTSISRNTRNMRGSMAFDGLWCTHRATKACWSLA